MRAYGNNPTLNAQRANVRSTDENVPRAKSGFRPRITGAADTSVNYTETRALGVSRDQTTLNTGAGLTLDQNIFNGNRTVNSVRQAESAVLGARETLRNTEQNTLLDAATSYMNVLRDTAILNLQRNNIEVLEEQLRQVRDRFNVGEVTRTDVAQSEARLALAQSQAAVAEANLRSSIGRYQQVVGVEPRSLAPGQPLDRLVPRSLEDAQRLAQAEHPAIKASLHGVDVAALQVRITEGELYPTLGFRGTLSNRRTTLLAGVPSLQGGGSQSDPDAIGESSTTFSGSAALALSVPIYEGGEVYARTRQAKETEGQRRLEADSIRDQVRALVITSWGAYEAARSQIAAGRAQVEAAETALAGVREEARVGQRTTLDVLNAQQELLNARVNLIAAQRDRVVRSYEVVQATGRLNARYLGLRVDVYSPQLHYDQVKDLWGGLTTPDGR
jgi:outer membrane protein